MIAFHGSRAKSPSILHQITVHPVSFQLQHDDKLLGTSASLLVTSALLVVTRMLLGAIDTSDSYRQSGVHLGPDLQSTVDHGSVGPGLSGLGGTHLLRLRAANTRGVGAAVGP